MALNAKADVPTPGDTVDRVEFSKDKRTVAITFASGKRLTASGDFLADDTPTPIDPTCGETPTEGKGNG